jgi:hypothetical protein
LPATPLALAIPADAGTHLRFYESDGRLLKIKMGPGVRRDGELVVAAVSA